ncbi:MAG: hypothetical protein ACHQQ3_09335 [Gemmatimonadales bacterium]
MDYHDLAIFFMLVSGTLFVSTVGFAIAWVRSRERLLRERAEAATSRNAGTLTTGSLEQAVDAIAVELERVSEGQRFVTKLLGDRRDMVVRPVSETGAPKVNTPH